MPRKPEQPPPEVALYLAIPREDAAKKIEERVERGGELKDRPIAIERQLEEVRQEYWTWNEYNEEMLRRIFTSPKIAEEYSRRASISAFVVGAERNLYEDVEELHGDIDQKLRRLASIKGRLELIPLAPSNQIPASTQSSIAAPTSGKVFVVHGHDEGVREAVARFISSLGLTPIILHEQAGQSKTVIEKLEHHGDVAYAIVLLTPDDVGGTNREDLRPRARQNVVLELGYFMGRLRRERVCAIHRGDIELPSDYMGVVYIPYDRGGGWRLHLAKELREAGFSIDMNKAIW
jgi:predicted nucleotide-binding protein